MTLPASPPTRAAAALPLAQRGRTLSFPYLSDGWPVYALQTILNTAGSSLVLDGAFGGATNTELRAAQESWGLTSDGVAGPATKVATSEVVSMHLERDLPSLPKQLAPNMARAEGGNNPGNVNPDVPGGVDCGLWQLRVFGPPYSIEVMKIAFSARRSGRRLLGDHEASGGIPAGYLFTLRQLAGRAWTGTSRERAGRCAVMSHNWPAGARTIADTGKCSSPNSPCTWVTRNDDGSSKVRFPDGTRVETRWDWCCFYAGFDTRHGEGALTKGVVWA